VKIDMPKKNNRIDKLVVHHKKDGTLGVTRARKVVKQDITKEQFLTNLEKVARPINKDTAKSDLGNSET
jgi:hypothetical protein